MTVTFASVINIWRDIKEEQEHEKETFGIFDHLSVITILDNHSFIGDDAFMVLSGTSVVKACSGCLPGSHSALARPPRVTLTLLKQQRE